MKKLLLLLGLILAGIGITRADSYTITFSSTANSAMQLSTSTKATTFIASNSQEYVDASPVTAATSAYYGGTSADEKTWIRIGKSKAKGNLTLKLSTKWQVKATSIIVSVKKYSQNDENATLTLNGKSETISSDSFEDKTFTLNGDEALTQLTLSTNAPSSNKSNRIYIQSITINYGGNVPPEPVELGELSATCNGVAIENPLTIEEGTPIMFYADNATSFVVTTEVGADEIPATNGSAEWTPGICENTSVSVVAKREVEGEETQISETASFTLTVKKVDYVIANWIIISAPSTPASNEVDLDLTLDPIESSPGKWHAYAKSSYTSGISGGAQLGSTKNPFTDGTITLTDSDIPANAIIKEIIFNGFTNDAYTLAVTVNGESAGNITVAKSTAQDHKLSGFELTGNNVVFTATSASKYLCVKGISIKYTIPEEQPGEIVVDYTQQFCEEANEDKTELTMMAGAELRFSSMAAAKMEITTDEEGIELPEAVNEANITWTVPADIIATIKVTASSESGEKTSERVYTICSEDITPEIPEYIFENDSKSVMISTKAGALKIMAAPYTPTPEENTAMMAIEAQGWSFTPGNDPKSYEFSYEGMESTMNVSVKSITPTKESDVVSFYVSNDGQVSGIENVATDVIAGEAVYYNLQGQRVNADRPGLYIRKQGGKAEKFIIR